ncbi:hypothetical protein PG989_007205 [Apiospora arundinis]
MRSMPKSLQDTKDPEAPRKNPPAIDGRIDMCDNCRLNRLAVQAFWDAQPPDKPSSLQVVKSRPPFTRESIDWVQVLEVFVVGPDERQPEAHEVNEFSHRIQLEISTPPGQVLPWPGYKQATPTADHANSAESFAKIKDWVVECFRDHPACAQTSREGPKRLIDTGPLDGEDALEVRLVDWPGDSPDDEPVKYCALSYSWGENERFHFTTTRETEQLRRQHIPVDQLPPTLKDAVAITRGVGCRYLWMPSASSNTTELTGSPNPPRMSTIYGNAFLVLTATEGASPGDGIFMPRPVVATFDYAVGEKTYQARVRERDDHSFWRLRHRVVVFPRPRVLHTRAWAFQERMLAARVVHYTATELVWECNTHCRCECGELARWAPGSEFAVGQSLKSHFASRLAGRRGSWETIVENYSIKRLTVASDWLPALSGLAQRQLLASAHRQDMGKYLAGVWSSQLPDALLWFIFADRRAETYRAPSWSWAAWEGEIRCMSESSMKYQHGRRCPEFEVLEAECTLASSDPYGAVTDGHIVVKGQFRPHLNKNSRENVLLETWALKVRQYRYLLLVRSQRVEGAWEVVDSAASIRESDYDGEDLSIIKIV